LIRARSKKWTVNEEDRQEYQGKVGSFEIVRQTAASVLAFRNKSTYRMHNDEYEPMKIEDIIANPKNYSHMKVEVSTA
jgi:hypothetical protein